jgi:hypothetical protein
MQQRDTTTVPSLVLSTAHRVVRRIAIDRARLTIGRRAINDILLDDMTVSGEHAVLHAQHGVTLITDLGSRNGTLVNGVPVTRQVLLDGDCIEIGVYTLTYVAELLLALPFERPLVAQVKRLTGQRAGQTIRIDRPKVSLRADCGSIAVIAHRRHAHHLTHVDGRGCPLINGEPIGLGSRELNDDDLIELGTCVFQFGPDHGPEPD